MRHPLAEDSSPKGRLHQPLDELLPCLRTEVADRDSKAAESCRETDAFRDASHADPFNPEPKARTTISGAGKNYVRPRSLWVSASSSPGVHAASATAITSSGSPTGSVSVLARQSTPRRHLRAGLASASLGARRGRPAHPHGRRTLRAADERIAKRAASKSPRSPSPARSSPSASTACATERHEDANRATPGDLNPAHGPQSGH